MSTSRPQNMSCEKIIQLLCNNSSNKMQCSCADIINVCVPKLSLVVRFFLVIRVFSLCKIFGRYVQKIDVSVLILAPFYIIAFTFKRATLQPNSQITDWGIKSTPAQVATQIFTNFENWYGSVLRTQIHTSSVTLRVYITALKFKKFKKWS